MKSIHFSQCLGLMVALGLTGCSFISVKADEPDCIEDTETSAEIQDSQESETETREVPEESGETDEAETDESEKFERQEAEPSLQTFAGAGFTVQAVIPEGALPENTILQVTSYSNDSQEMNTVLASAGLSAESAAAAVFQIEWFKDGIPIEPEVPIHLLMEMDQELLSRQPCGFLQVFFTGIQHQPVLKASENSTSTGQISRDGSLFCFECDLESSGTLMAAAEAELPEAEVLYPCSAQLHVRTVIAGLSQEPEDYVLRLSDPNTGLQERPAVPSGSWTADEQGNLSRDWFWKPEELSNPESALLTVQEGGTDAQQYDLIRTIRNAAQHEAAWTGQESPSVKLDNLCAGDLSIRAWDSKDPITDFFSGNALILCMKDGSSVILSCEPLNFSMQKALEATAAEVSGSSQSISLEFYVLPQTGSRKLLSTGSAVVLWDFQSQILDLKTAEHVQASAIVSFDPAAARRPDLEIVDQYELVSEPVLENTEAVNEETSEAAEETLSAETIQNTDSSDHLKEAVQESRTKPSPESAAERNTEQKAQSEKNEIEAVPTGLRRNDEGAEILPAIAIAAAAVFAASSKKQTKKRS